MFLIFLLRTWNVGTRKGHLTEAVIMSTHKLCFLAKIRKIVYPSKQQFYCMEAGFKRVHFHGHVFMMFRYHFNHAKTSLVIRKFQTSQNQMSEGKTSLQ